MKNQRDRRHGQLVFGTVTVDLRRRLLLRQNERQDLSETYWNALVLLIDRRPEVVGKAELQSVLQLTEQSLPKAIELIRHALGDTTEPRRFILTERGAGYRFIAAESLRRSRRWLILTTVGVAVLLASTILFRTMLPPRVKPKQFYRLARANRADIPLLTDGQYIYFGQWDNGRFAIGRVPSMGGDVSIVSTSLPNPELCDISPDGQYLLVRSIPAGGFRDNPAPLWVIRVNGEIVGPVGGIEAVDASWTPDGKAISYSNGPEVFLVEPDGSHKRRFALVETNSKVLIWWLRWTLDGRRLRFTLTKSGIRGRSIWEVSTGDINPHPLLGLEQFVDACCGSWTSDARRYVFGATTRDGATQLWSIDEQSPRNAEFWLSQALAPFGLTSYRGPLISRDGRKLFMRATVAQGEVVSYDSKAQSWTPVLRDISAGILVPSYDGRKIAYTTLPDLALWIANTDGSGRQQITGAALQAAMPRWAPDGEQVAFMGRLPGQAWRIYLFRFPDTTPRAVLPDYVGQQADPDWSPSGGQLVFGQNPASPALTEGPTVFIIDLASGKLTPLPGSSRLDSPRWSPDGRSIVALESGTRRLMLYEFDANKWSPLTDSNAASSGYPCWSSDSKSVYFLSAERRPDATSENVVLRLDVKSRMLSRFASLAGIRQGAFSFGTWIGLNRRDFLLAVRDLTTQEIDALDWP